METTKPGYVPSCPNCGSPLVAEPPSEPYPWSCTKCQCYIETPAPSPAEKRHALAAKITSAIYDHVQKQRCTCAECQDAMADLVATLLEHPDLPMDDMQAKRLPPFGEASMADLRAIHTTHALRQAGIDGTEGGRLIIHRSADGDVWVNVIDAKDPKMASVRLCSFTGGGKVLHTRRALVATMLAVQQDGGEVME